MSLVPTQPTQSSSASRPGLPAKPDASGHASQYRGKGKAVKGQGGGKGGAGGKGKGKQTWGMRSVDNVVEGPGVFATCVRGKDRVALAELFALFTSLADELYPTTTSSTPSSPSRGYNTADPADESLANGGSKGKAKETRSIEEELEDDLREMKKGPDVVERFVHYETHIDCVLFISFKKPLDPVHIIHHYLSTVSTTGHSLLRNIHRLVPISGTCLATLPSLLSLVEKHVVPELAANPGLSWRINYSSRLSESLVKNEVLVEVPKLVGNKVALEGSDRVVLIELFKRTVGVSIVKDYDRFRKYNPQQVVDDYNHRKKIETGRVNIGAGAGAGVGVSSVVVKVEEAAPIVEGGVSAKVVDQATTRNHPTQPGGREINGIHEPEEEQEREGSLDSLFNDPDEPSHEFPAEAAGDESIVPRLRDPFAPRTPTPAVVDADGDIRMEEAGEGELGEGRGLGEIEGDGDEGEAEERDGRMEEGEVEEEAVVPVVEKNVDKPTGGSNGSKVDKSTLSGIRAKIVHPLPEKPTLKAPTAAPETPHPTRRAPTQEREGLDDVDLHILASTSESKPSDSVRVQAQVTPMQATRDTPASLGGGLQARQGMGQVTPTPKMGQARSGRSQDAVAPPMQQRAPTTYPAGPPGNGHPFARPPPPPPPAHAINSTPGRVQPSLPHNPNQSHNAHTIPATIPAVRPPWPPVQQQQQQQQQQQHHHLPLPQNGTNGMMQYHPPTGYPGYLPPPPQFPHGYSNPQIPHPPTGYLPIPPYGGPPPIPYASRPGGSGSPQMRQMEPQGMLLQPQQQHAQWGHSVSPQFGHPSTFPPNGGFQAVGVPVYPATVVPPPEVEAQAVPTPQVKAKKEKTSGKEKVEIKTKEKVKPPWKRGEPIKRDRKGCCWHCGAGAEAAGPGTVERGVKVKQEPEPEVAAGPRSGSKKRKAVEEAGALEVAGGKGKRKKKKVVIGDEGNA